ncbi:galactan 5-O-arabinofuranosyltransferase [Corynebacterium frankenforstense]|uniref:galactan 5-O-arabinofuranosyltransferase n=1 Tax=Corynebacterium frankenforstense TaxID=1230998 RepID=UPI0026F141BF|nr:galactan 5-O-arabinofuranosyltransferase [Corynebacterium frankenforstense]
MATSSTASPTGDPETPVGASATPVSGETTTDPEAHRLTPPPAPVRPDRWGRGATVAAILLAALAGAVATLAGWLVLRAVSLPAFNTSMVTRALATAGTVVVVAAVVVLCALWIRERDTDADKTGANTGADTDNPRPRWRTWLTVAVTYLAPAGLVLTSTGVPLSATRLYLDGLQADQSFRTQFLTRMTQTAHLADMNYWDLPSYYPSAWFWGGGRLANLLGLPGWEVYQPWALVSIAAAACALVPVWQRLTGSLPQGAAIALVTTSIMLVMNPEEPYATIIAMGAAAAVLVARRAVDGSWFATLGVAVYLGVSASMYTLYTGLLAGTVVVLAFWAAAAHRSIRPLFHLLAAGLGSMAIAAVVWAPYLIEELTGGHASGATAMHYLPGEGTRLPMPFLAFSLVGFLCLVGLVYLIAGWRDLDARALAIATGCFYGWILLSMLVTSLGTTLLGFRADVLVTVALATAGMLALARLRAVGPDKLYPDRVTPAARRTVSLVLVCLLGLAGLAYAQQIPGRNEEHIDHAYVDTDGYGERADRFAPDATQYYAEIDQTIREAGRVPEDTVVFTDEIRFMAYYPYFGFQSFTSHYANPLGEFDHRNEAIEQWAADSWEADPRGFVDEVEDTPWRAPDVFVMRGDVEAGLAGEDAYKVHLAEDIYPNQPNVRYRAVFFNPEVFDDADLWTVEQVGPFVVAVRR